MEELEQQQPAPEAETEPVGHALACPSPLETEPPPAVSMEELMAADEPDADAAPEVSLEDAPLQAVLEAIVYVAEEIGRAHV